MLFFPFKADIKLSRFPFITILITIACLFIYWQQTKSEDKIYDFADTFCQEQSGRMHNIIMKKIALGQKHPTESICYTVFLSIHYSSKPNDIISEFTGKTAKFTTKSLKSTHKYINNYLTKKSIEFNQNVPSNLSNTLRYDPDSLNVLTMITSAFAHGSWSHVIGNLFFFFAFAATIEAVLGLLFYPLFIVGIAIITNLVYSLAVMSTPESIPTLGLSGVVMGTMGLFTYFIPKAKIRCFFWFIIIIRKFGIPAWVLATWYFGWDVYELYNTGTASGVNLIAHVSGFAGGFLAGLILFRWRKREIHAELERSNNSNTFQKAMSY